MGFCSVSAIWRTGEKSPTTTRVKVRVYPLPHCVPSCKLDQVLCLTKAPGRWVRGKINQCTFNRMWLREATHPRVRQLVSLLHWLLILLSWGYFWVGRIVGAPKTLPLSKVPGCLLKGGQDSRKHWIAQTQRVGGDFLSRASIVGGSLDWCPFLELGRTHFWG